MEGNVASRSSGLIQSKCRARAVDNAIEKLPVEKSLRVGRPEKVLPHLREYMLSYKARTRLGQKLKEIENKIKELKKEHLQILKHLSWLRKEKLPSTDFGASAKKRLKTKNSMINIKTLI